MDLITTVDAFSGVGGLVVALRLMRMFTGLARHLGVTVDSHGNVSPMRPERA